MSKETTFFKGFITGGSMVAFVGSLIVTRCAVPDIEDSAAERICAGLVKNQPGSREIEIIDNKCFVREWDGTRRPLRFPPPKAPSP